MKSAYKAIALALLCTTLPASAAHLLPEQALERALSQTTDSRRVKAAATTYSFAGSRGSLYVFNRTGNDGFIITPSDSNLRPILARVDSGSFDGDAIPPAMQWLLSIYEAEAAEAADIEPAASVPDYYLDWQKIEPLVKARWNQSAPYNNRCPKVRGNETPTGCVATAMAQIIYHHCYAKGSGKIRYQLYADYSWQTFDFESAEFDFDAMTDTYTDKSPADACEAVAELMEACGKSVEMDYQPGSSGAIPDKVPAALIKYFGYDNHTRICNRDEYQTEQWETIIYKELLAGRPLFHSGATDGGSAHAFVCDGYDGNGLFHINWGWGGSSDGFFSLTALKPGTVGIGAQPGGFNNVQQIVLIVPPGATDFTDTEVIAPDGKPDIMLTDVEMSPLCSGEDFYFTCTAVNKGRADLRTVSARVFLYALGSDEPIAYGDELRSYNVAAGDARRSTFRMALVTDKGASIPAGEYELFLCNSSGTPLAEDAGFKVTVTNDKPDNKEFSHWGQLTINDAESSIPEFLIKGKSVKLTPSLRNDDANTPVTFGLGLFKPGTDELVWSYTQTMTIMNTNGRYLSGFPYFPEFSVGSAPLGTFDAAYILSTGQLISERRTVKVAERVNRIAYAPDAEGKSVTVVPANYSGDIIIPSEVTFRDGSTFPVSAIEPETFLDNNSVTSIDFPETLTSIGLHSLRYLRNVETIRFRSEQVPFPHIAIAGYRMNPHVRIIVPAGSLVEYTEALSPYLPEADTQDAIEEITAAPEPERPAAVYDLQGRRLAAPARGINILNGRKVLLR